MNSPINVKMNDILVTNILELEEIFDADFLYIDSSISLGLHSIVMEEIESLKNDSKLRDTMCVMFTTNGGDANSTVRLVNVLRHYYKIVNYIIPDHAYSAGTILCMSGDKIYMNYNSVLGPIDPQVKNKEGRYVPALGYLEKIEDLLKKAKDGTLSQAEFLILKDFDLAEISLYEQARDLTVDLLKDWLKKYKFKDWETHSSNGKKVTEKDKEKRAAKIAKELGNYKRWKAHGRLLNMETLSGLKLVIDDFGKNEKMEKSIMSFYRMATDFKMTNDIFAMTFSRGGKL